MAELLSQPNLQPRASLRNKPLPRPPSVQNRTDPNVLSAIAEVEADAAPSRDSTATDPETTTSEPVDYRLANQAEAMATIEHDEVSEKARLALVRQAEQEAEARREGEPSALSPSEPPSIDPDEMYPLNETKEPRIEMEDVPAPDYAGSSSLYPLNDEKGAPAIVSRHQSRRMPGFIPSSARRQPTADTSTIVPGGLTRLSSIAEGKMPSLGRSSGAGLPLELMHLAQSPLEKRPSLSPASSFYRGGGHQPIPARQWLDARWEAANALSSSLVTQAASIPSNATAADLSSMSRQPQQIHRVPSMPSMAVLSRPVASPLSQSGWHATHSASSSQSSLAWLNPVPAPRSSYSSPDTVPTVHTADYGASRLAMPLPPPLPFGVVTSSPSLPGYFNSPSPQVLHTNSQPLRSATSWTASPPPRPFDSLAIVRPPSSTATAQHSAEVAVPCHSPALSVSYQSQAFVTRDATGFNVATAATTTGEGNVKRKGSFFTRLTRRGTASQEPG